MRFAALTAVTLLTLGACATGPARPSAVQLDRDLLTVTMSDGSTCLGPATGAASSGWSGRLQSCPWDYAYTVEIDPGTNPVRFILQEVFTALGGADILSPIATVTITDGTGRERRFETPERIDLDD